MKEIKDVGVCGCGLMGSGIAACAAAAGFPTVVCEVAPMALEQGRERVTRSLEKMKQPEALRRISFMLEFDALRDCDLVVEAVVENMEAKRKLFADLDVILPQHSLLASNTSSLGITEMAASTRRPDRFIGMHFFNPVPVMKLVELSRGLKTSEETLAAARAFVARIGKTAILAPDAPGFIVNRLLVPYLIEAIRVYEQGLASKEDIDAGMKLGCAHPMGPLELLDYVGLDTTLHIAEIFFEAFGEARYAPPTLLRKMVAAGKLGRKSGEGFYRY
ncbi:MAG: 3-hydroxybutyryl-CoA dehydrogenase [Planctomycetes bacterium]|nr:3-hydroxybutyryl-CoA dehydrogenase [Planctomycetota bacterium]